MKKKLRKLNQKGTEHRVRFMHTDQDETFHLHFPQRFQIKSFKGIKWKQG